ncbi:caspase family protein [Nocardiopsis sp. ARC36]
MLQKIIRKALVIGVGSIPEAEHRFPSLSDPVAIDVQTLCTGLTGSGYEVEELLNPTRNEITGAITRVAEKAPPSSVQLIHFTGHGVRIDATDYLLPSDARVPGDDAPASWRRPHIRESLLDIDISGYLEGCRAGTVLWTVDACRASEDSTGEPAFGNHMSKGHQGGGFAVITGCGPGQRCGYTDEGSHFTSALAKAFGPLTTATTVEEVYDLARRHTTQLAARHHSEPQEPKIRYGADLEEQTKITEVAQGRRLLESWQKAVKDTPLWGHVPDADHDGARFFQEWLAYLAEKVAHQVHMAQKRLSDPWTDDGFPVRLLCDRLPQLLSKDTELSALEVTALISGVFLHESAWADRLSQASEVTPQTTCPLSDANDQRRYYEQVIEHYPQITRKLEINSSLSRLSKRARRLRIRLYCGWCTVGSPSVSRPTSAPSPTNQPPLSPVSC